LVFRLVFEKFREHAPSCIHDAFAEGVPVGKYLTENAVHTKEMGSIIVIIGPDIPMLPHQLKRLAKRASIGMGSGGSPGGNDSGDIFLAFSTANEMSVHQKEVPILNMKFTNDQQFDPIYEKTCHAIMEVMKKYNR
jgi:D-aminopeptidase